MPQVAKFRGAITTFKARVALGIYLDVFIFEASVRIRTLEPAPVTLDRGDARTRDRVEGGLKTPGCNVTGQPGVAELEGERYVLFV